MTIDEAIYCMKSYLPDYNEEHCLKCKYYGSKKKGDVFVCNSSEAHLMAIKALEKLKTDSIDFGTIVRDLKDYFEKGEK